MNTTRNKKQKPKLQILSPLEQMRSVPKTKIDLNKVLNHHNNTISKGLDFLNKVPSPFQNLETNIKIERRNYFKKCAKGSKFSLNKRPNETKPYNIFHIINRFVNKNEDNQSLKRLTKTAQVSPIRVKRISLKSSVDLKESPRIIKPTIKENNFFMTSTNTKLSTIKQNLHKNLRIIKKKEDVLGVFEKKFQKSLHNSSLSSFMASTNYPSTSLTNFNSSQISSFSNKIIEFPIFHRKEKKTKTERRMFDNKLKSDNNNKKFQRSMMRSNSDAPYHFKKKFPEASIESILPSFIISEDKEEFVDLTSKDNVRKSIKEIKREMNNEGTFVSFYRNKEKKKFLSVNPNNIFSVCDNIEQINNKSANKFRKHFMKKFEIEFKKDENIWKGQVKSAGRNRSKS